MEYKIIGGQTALDVVNQLYTTTDYISKLMLDNDEFDINEMNENEIVNYDSINNQVRNEIINNNYIFVNRDNIVYSDIIEESFDKGIHDVSDKIGSYCYIVNQKEYKWITTTNNTLSIYSPTTVIFYIESII